MIYNYIMVVVKKKFKKIAYTVLTALGIGMLTSCYGMPTRAYSIDYFSLHGKVTAEGTNKEIPGIKVTVNYGGEIKTYITDSSGNYFFDLYFDSEDFPGGIDVTITLTDIDGETNGTYSTKTLEPVRVTAESHEIEKNISL